MTTTMTPKQQAALDKMGITSDFAALTFLPLRHEDRSVAQIEHDTCGKICITGKVRSPYLKESGRGHIFFCSLISADSRTIKCVWFNMRWLSMVLTEGTEVSLYGQVKGGAITNPEVEVLKDKSSIHFGKLVPVYPCKEAVAQRTLRGAMWLKLQECSPWQFAHPETKISDFKNLHFPKTTDDLNAAREQVILEEFCNMQRHIISKRLQREDGGFRAMEGSGAIWAQVKSSLPFDLTGSQEKAISEISRDMAASRRMNRLLQGDVGSGKTLVALYAMMQAIESGCSSALMAPTQILAEQHYLSFRKILDPLGVPIQLMTSSRDELSIFGKGKPSLVVGTHALLFQEEVLPNLGLVVIDEQHKFGVEQRQKLIDHKDNPDVLIMTATPIPRTIIETLYGDLEVSTLKDKPPGRGEVITSVRTEASIQKIIDFLKIKIQDGNQVYIVYPLIEKSRALDLKSATEEFEKWKEKLPGIHIGLIHGRLSSEEKESVMKEFREGRMSVLISTTVIEVGVDVPNATVMLIEEAHRFGLSQLHQLRGRIGRGSKQSHCILMRGAKSDGKRLKIMESTSDGFEIAEADLKLRGAGDLLGTEQSGLPPLYIGDLVRDHKIMQAAKEYMEGVLCGY